jgi:hypothetical protein
MFYLSKIAAEDPAVHNLDFKPIRFEKFRGMSFLGYRLLNRYPLYYGPQINIPKNYSLTKILGEPAFNKKRTPEMFEYAIKYNRLKFGLLTLSALKLIYQCIHEMLLNGYFQKTNLTNLELIEDHEKLLLAKYMFQTSLASVRLETISSTSTIIPWHIDNHAPGTYNWLVNFGQTSTRYDKRLCVREKASTTINERPATPPIEHIGYLPLNRVIGIHGNHIHAGPDPIEDRSKSRMVILLRSGFSGANTPNLLREKFEKWKNRPDAKNLDKKFAIFYQ